jgi:hypothetical protein
MCFTCALSARQRYTRMPWVFIGIIQISADDYCNIFEQQERYICCQKIFVWVLESMENVQL